jgi:xanthine dehydrogenase YagS FAD-binding subunit
MQAFEYANPATLQDAFALLGQRWGQTEVLAGGTDLLGLMKDYVETPGRLVNIKSIKELGGIQKTGGGYRIGATVTMDELVDNAEIRKLYPSLHTAAANITSPQIRSVGTVAGDLCQRPRCWYYRQGLGLLARDAKGQSLAAVGDNRYHAILGNGGPAKFVSASSLGPALVALGARVKLASARGTRELAVEQFFVAPTAEGAREIALQPNEILTEVVIPSAAARNATYEVRQKEALDWPLATASVALQMKGSTVTSARVVLGHVAPTPWLAAEAGSMLAGKAVNAESAEAAARAALTGATPLSGNAYKVQLARTAVKRALIEAARGRA